MSAKGNTARKDLLVRTPLDPARCIETPKDISYDDVFSWYSDCTVVAKYKLGRLKMGTIAPSDSREVVRFAAYGDAEYGTVKVADLCAYWPDCGAVNIGTKAVYVRRVSRRQWRRSYTPRSIEISVPGSWQLREHLSERQLRRPPVNDIAVATAVMTPSYPRHYDDAENLLKLPIEKGGMGSVALNKQLTLCRSHVPEERILFYRTEPVAKVINGVIHPYSSAPVVKRATKLFSLYQGA